MRLVEQVTSGHPWNDDTLYEKMYVEVESMTEQEEEIQLLLNEGWALWISDDNKPAFVVYRLKE